MDVLICTGDRDAFQLVTDHVTVLYPRAGVSDMARMTPGRCRGSTASRPAQYPDFAALRGDPSDNLPGIPAWGRRPPPSGSAISARSTSLVDRVDEVKGKAGDACARTSPTSSATAAHRAGARRPARRRPARPAPRPWDREEVHRLFDTLQFRVLRDRLYATLAVAEPEADSGFEIDGAAARARRVGRLARRARRGRRPRRLAVAGTWGRGTGVLTGIAFAAADGAGAYVDPTQLDRVRRAGTRRLARRPDQPKALHDAKGPLLALAAHGWTSAGLTQRHRACRLPGTARPAQLRPRRPRAALPPPRAARRATRRRASCFARRSVDERSRRGRDRAGPRGRSTSPTRSTAISSDRGGTALLTEVELPLIGVLASIERTGIAADLPPRRPLDRARRRGQGRRAGGLRGRRPRVQPGLTQAAAADPVRRARAAQDQEDQDRLHDRRRRAAEPARADRAPAARAPAAPPRRDAAARPSSTR